MYGFDRIWRGNYFGAEPIGKAEVDLRMGNSRMERLQARMK